ncbi:hypothetical protein V6Z11_A05G334500 [Gossypium hirsutum]
MAGKEIILFITQNCWRLWDFEIPSLSLTMCGLSVFWRWTDVFWRWEPYMLVTSWQSPISIAAAVIYIITYLSNDKKPLKDISVATGVAEGTIRNS